MTNEEMQSTMHFIIEQQAQFAVNIQKIEESQAQFAINLQKLEESQAQFVVNLHKLEQSQESLTRLVGEIAKAQARTEVNLAMTDDRLNNLITVFERYLSNHRNGNPQDEQ